MIAETYCYEGSMYGFFSTLQNFPLSNRASLYRTIGERDVPTLVMWGTDDNVTPITEMDTSRELLRATQTHVIDCGHMAPYERPADVVQHLVTFINSHPDRITS